MYDARIYIITMLFWSHAKLLDWRPVNYGIRIQIFACVWAGRERRFERIY